MVDDADTDEDLGVGAAIPQLVLTPEQALRAFIFKHYSGGDLAMVDGRIFVDNMELVLKWLKDGIAPDLSVRQRNKFTIVPKGDLP